MNIIDDFIAQYHKEHGKYPFVYEIEEYTGINGNNIISHLKYKEYTKSKKITLIEKNVLLLHEQGLKPFQIANKLDVKQTAVRSALERLNKKGFIKLKKEQTHEKEHRVYIKITHDVILNGINFKGCGGYIQRFYDDASELYVFHDCVGYKIFVENNKYEVVGG